MEVETSYTNKFLDVIADGEEAGIDAGEQVAWRQLRPPWAPPVGPSHWEGARVDGGKYGDQQDGSDQEDEDVDVHLRKVFS